MNCPYCKSASLRNSRWRVEDLPLLLLLRVPARCRNCMSRCHVSIPVGRRLRREAELRRASERAARRDEIALERRSEAAMPEYDAG
jgi:hypothetical protein